MPAEHDPGAVSGAAEGLYYLGGLIAAVLLGFAGYLRKPRAESTTTTVAGAIVDNSALAPLLASLGELIDVIRLDISLRQAEAAEERRREELEHVAETVAELMTRKMRETPAAEMPLIRER